MSTSTNIESKREIINNFFEKDLNLMLIDSNYINHYDKKTKDIIKNNGIRIENFYILDKDMFLLRLRAVNEINNLKNILKT
ncbi:MAG: hypothetical protein EAX96_04105 [Candidatus Lokiarchaeota archaeon]|nr:hypothetical protein [Candidatus Lokiarchaeota archaeon]